MNVFKEIKVKIGNIEKVIAKSIILDGKDIKTTIEEAGKVKTINGQEPDENGNIQLMEKVTNLGIEVDQYGVLTISKDIPQNEKYELLVGEQSNGSLILQIKNNN